MKRKGVSVFSDAELLAIVPGRVNTKKNAIDMSNRLLKIYNFDGLFFYLFRCLKKEFYNQVPKLKCLLCA